MFILDATVYFSKEEIEAINDGRPSKGAVGLHLGGRRDKYCLPLGQQFYLLY